MAEDKGGPFQFTQAAPVVIALACGAVAVLHFRDPALAIDAVSLGLLGTGVGFLYSRRLKIGPTGAEATLDYQLAEADRVPVPTQPAVTPAAPVNENLDATIAALAAPQRPAPPLPAVVPPLPGVGELLSAIEAVRIETTVLAGNTGRLVPADLCAYDCPFN